MCIYARTALAIVLLIRFISVCKSNGINNNRKPWYKSPAHIKIEKAMFGKVAEEQEKQRYTKNDEQKLEADYIKTNEPFYNQKHIRDKNEKRVQQPEQQKLATTYQSTHKNSERHGVNWDWLNTAKQQQNDKITFFMETSSIDNKYKDEGKDEGENDVTQDESRTEKIEPEEVKSRFEDSLDGLLGGNVEDDDLSSDIKNVEKIVNPATKKEEGGLKTDDDDKEKKKKEAANQKFYCDHFDSCGVRTLRGPSSVDSLQNGKQCVCAGVADNGHLGKCFQGTCYDRKNGSKRRDDADLDSHGLCEYTASDVVSNDHCDLKKDASRNPNTYSYIDNGLSAHIKKPKNGDDPLLKGT
jgi:hypothetical protein